MSQRVALLVILTVLAGACEREVAPAAPPMSSPQTTPRAPEPSALLDLMDARSPLPLLPEMAQHQKESMRDHLVAVQEIVAALAAGDFAAVESAAARIGFSERTGAMCRHMGAAAPGFTEQALGFHRTADRIAAAARERDRARVLGALGETLDTCTTCHATWKQEIVDEPTWKRLTSAEPPQRDAAH